MTNWDGQEFADDAEDFAKRGQPLADGFCGILFVLRSDLDFLSGHFQLKNSSSNYPCALCRGDRFVGSRPWTDCRGTAAWRSSSVWKAADWAAENPSCHALFRMPGGGLDWSVPI